MMKQLKTKPVKQREMRDLASPGRVSNQNTVLSRRSCRVERVDRADRNVNSKHESLTMQKTGGP